MSVECCSVPPSAEYATLAITKDVTLEIRQKAMKAGLCPWQAVVFSAFLGRVHAVPDTSGAAFLRAEMGQSIPAIGAEHSEPTLRRRSQRETIMRIAQNISTNLLTASAQ